MLCYVMCNKTENDDHFFKFQKNNIFFDLQWKFNLND